MCAWLKKIKLERELQKERDRQFAEQIAIREKRFAAAQIIRRLIIGFMNRFEPFSCLNDVYLKKVYEAYLIKLAKVKLPTSLLDGFWPNIHPKTCENVLI